MTDADGRTLPVIPDHELLQLVGRGSYGEVWLALNTLGARRAVKIVRRQSFDSPRPFEREFSGIRRFEPISREHDGLVDILHVGRAESGEFFYCVMELADPLPATAAEGNPTAYRPTTLGGLVEQQGRFSTADCLPIFVSLTSALAHLHDHGLVHRDIKPTNIIFVSGVAKLADIGLVAEIGAARSFVGTEGFIAPEGPGSVASDIFALGKVIYEAATGRDRSEFPSLPIKSATDLDKDPGLPELNAIILRACAPSPAERYPTARALLADLLLLQSGGSVQRVRRMEQGLARVRRGLLWVAGVALMAVLFFGGLAQRERELRTRAQNAEGEARVQNREAREQLRRARLSEARAVRLSGLAGRRSRALTALREAAKVRIDTELQSEAAASLALTDLETHPLDPLPSGSARVTWAPGLRRFANIGTNGTIQLREAATGQVQLTLHGAPLADEGLFEFSPQGRWLLCRRTGGLKEVFDLKRPEVEPRRFNQGVYEWHFSPDDAHMAWITTNRGIEIREVATGVEVSHFHPTLPVGGSAYSADGKWLALYRATDSQAPEGVRRVEVWDWTAARMVREVTLPSAPILVAWGENDSLAVALEDFQIRIYPANPRQPELVLPGHQGRVTALQPVPGRPGGNRPAGMAPGGYGMEIRVNPFCAGRLPSKHRVTRRREGPLSAGIPGTSPGSWDSGWARTSFGNFRTSGGPDRAGRGWAGSVLTVAGLSPARRMASVAGRRNRVNRPRLRCPTWNPVAPSSRPQDVCEFSATNVSSTWRGILRVWCRRKSRQRIARS